MTGDAWEWVGIVLQKRDRKYKTTGHVFQGRRKAIIVDKDVYLLREAPAIQGPAPAP
jgi:hypothetical protein